MFAAARHSHKIIVLIKRMTYIIKSLLNKNSGFVFIILIGVELLVRYKRFA